jgi:hypothetical protein
MTPVEIQPQVLSGLYQKFADMSASMFPLQGLFPATPNPTFGPHVMYEVYEFTRGMAPLVPRFGQAPRTKLPVRTRVNLEAFTLKESFSPELCSLLDGTAPGSLSDSAKEKLIADGVLQLRLRNERRLEWLRAQMFTAGLLMTSGGVPIGTVPDPPTGIAYFDLLSQLNKANPFGITLGWTSTHYAARATASWATASTDIKKEIDTARVTIMRDSGVDARDLMMNSTTYGYLTNNTAALTSLYFADQVVRTGMVGQMWGYNIHLNDAIYFEDEGSMTATATTAYSMIPSKMVVLYSANNAVSGRATVECNPSDLRADQGSRGLYAWRDEQTEHPHEVSYGLEWTGIPVIMNPDSMWVWGDVTDTT